MPTEPLPSYDDLPVRLGLPPGSSWGFWGDDDVFGCLNLLTPERIVAAAALVQKGAVFALNLDLDLPDPPLFGRRAPEHTVHTGRDGRSHDDELAFNTQSSSQWDGFRHVGSHHGFYNGVADEDHGMHHWATRGIAGRAVLADVGRWRAETGQPIDCRESEPITVDDVLSCLDHQQTTVETGDILLLRTGWVGWYRSLDHGARVGLAADLRAPGLVPGEATARGLWDLHISAIAADNPAVEVWPAGVLADDATRQAARDDPDKAMELFVHFSLLPLLGLPLGELWDLEALGDDCAADKRYECFFTSAPLKVTGGVASPPNAVAIK
ncbi:MAG: cyclase family protein [Acidimicrobiales bacterium]